jgi:hypothetical protein
MRRSAFPGLLGFAKIPANILQASRLAAVIQSLFLAVEGAGPSQEEIGAYCRRLQKSWKAGANRWCKSTPSPAVWRWHRHAAHRCAGGRDRRAGEA